MKIPFHYHTRSLFRRGWATLLTITAIGCSVAVLAVMLGLAHGFERSLGNTGQSDNLIVLRQGAGTEGESYLGRDQAQIIASLPGVARSAEDLPLAGPETYAAVALNRVGGGTTNVPFRGVSVLGPQIQATATLGEGRWFNPGTREVVVGRGLVERIEGCRLGGAIRFSGQEWPIVGIIESPEHAWNSEIWTDVEGLMQVLDRTWFSTMVIRAAPGQIDNLVERVATDQRLQMKAEVQPTYYAAQSGALGGALVFVGSFLSVIMAIGSAFGATNTMLASLQGRQREIGTLLAIGYRPWQVFLGFLMEATVLGTLGGLIGLVIALPVHGWSTGTTNWQTFTEQVFSIQLSGEILLIAVIFGGLVGVLGGTLPAWRASGLHPTVALRAT